MTEKPLSVEDTLRIKREVNGMFQGHASAEELHGAITRCSGMTEQEIMQESLKDFDELCAHQQAFQATWLAEKRCACVEKLPNGYLPACNHVMRELRKRDKDLQARALQRTLFRMNQAFLQHRLKQEAGQ